MRIYLLICFLALPAAAEEIILRPTIPGTEIPDYTSERPGWIIRENGAAIPTIPGTTIPDYTSPYRGYKIERRPNRVRPGWK